MNKNIEEYFRYKVLTLLNQSRELLDGFRPEKEAFLQETEHLISYMRCHGDTAIKDIIDKVWD